jgi:hypothetical protein
VLLKAAGRRQRRVARRDEARSAAPRRGSVSAVSRRGPMTGTSASPSISAM